MDLAGREGKKGPQRLRARFALHDYPRAFAGRQRSPLPIIVPGRSATSSSAWSSPRVATWRPRAGPLGHPRIAQGVRPAGVELGRAFHLQRSKSRRADVGGVRWPPLSCLGLAPLRRSAWRASAPSAGSGPGAPLPGVPLQGAPYVVCHLDRGGRRGLGHRRSLDDCPPARPHMGSATAEPLCSSRAVRGSPSPPSWRSSLPP